MKNLALFDFDGTLTYSDSVYFFFQSLYKSRHSFFLHHYIIVFPYIIAYKLKLISLTYLKEVRLNTHLRQLSNEQIKTAIEHFKITFFSSQIRESGLIAIQNHLNNNDTVCVVSASWHPLLADWGDSNNISIITNNTFRRSDGSFKFLKPDCNYQEKVNRIKAVFNLDQFATIYAYGDTDGDKLMLDIANYAYYCYFN